MAITLDGTNGITTPDLDSSGPVTGTTGTFSGAVQASGVATNLYPLVSGTSVASTSGTSIDFTGIPSWVKRVTVMLSGVSTNGTSAMMVQLGTSSGFVSSGYVGCAGNRSAETAFTSGFLFHQASVAANNYNGMMTLNLVTSNTWSEMSILAPQVANQSFGAGSIALSDTLTQVRITTVIGTNTFDAGTINILFE